MKLYYSLASPYVRKVVVTAIEAGLDDEIERVSPSGSVWVGDGDAEASDNNPVGKIPTLIARDGAVLIDSTLICEYLSSLAPEANLLPPAGSVRWRVLNAQAMAQGAMDAIMLRAIETQMRPDHLFWDDWVARQTVKALRIFQSFDTMIADGRSDVIGDGAVNLGTITLGCVLGYPGQRLNDHIWRDNHSNLCNWYDDFSKRPSMMATIPAILPPAHLDPRKG
jgi:glutathione S-transferase